MTGHFVRRDLRDFLFWWVALAAVTVLVVAGALWLADPSLIVFVWAAYLMFALIAGVAVAPSNSKARPRCPKARPVQAARSTATVSSSRRPRCRHSEPSARNSQGR